MLWMELLNKLSPRQIITGVMTLSLLGFYAMSRHYRAQRDGLQHQLDLAAAQNEMLREKVDLATKLANSQLEAHHEAAKEILATPVPSKPEDAQKYIQDLLAKVPK